MPELQLCQARLAELPGAEVPADPPDGPPLLPEGGGDDP
jgi:hypothetical protein